jgi:hypothetical protein
MGKKAKDSHSWGNNKHQIGASASIRGIAQKSNMTRPS